jgi:hypothetical protein
MAGWGTFLAAIAGPIAKLILVTLGFGLVTWIGFMTVHAQIASAIGAALSLIHPDVYKIVALAGFIDFIGIWLGALTTAAILMAAKKLAMLA